MEQEIPQRAETNDDKESNSFANCPLCEHSCLPTMLRKHLIGAHSKELNLEEINMISEEAINCNWGTDTGNEASATITSVGYDNINDQMFNMESVLDDASLDSIKSDSMWSSVNLFPSLMDSHVNSSNTANSQNRRHRDVSLTLSECAEGLLSINQLDVVNMLEKFGDDPDPTLGASPTFLSSSFGASMMRGHENQNSNDSSNNIGVLPVEELETSNNVIPLAASRFSIVTMRGDIQNNVVEKTTPTTNTVDFGICNEIVGNSHRVHAVEDSIRKKLQLQAIRGVLHKPSCGREASMLFEQPQSQIKQTEQSVDKSGAWNGMEEALVSNWQRKMGPSCNIIVAQKSRFATNLPGAKFATTQNGHIFISMIGGQHYELLEIVGGPKITAFTPFLMEILDQLPGDARFVCVCSKAMENSTPLYSDSALISKWRSKMGDSYNIIVAQKSRFKTNLPGGTTQNGHYFVSMKYGYGEQHKYELLEIVDLKEPLSVSESELEVILDLMPEDAKFVCGLPKATRYDIRFPDITMKQELAQKKMELSHRKVINIFFIFIFHSWELNFLY